MRMIRRRAGYDTARFRLAGLSSVVRGMAIRCARKYRSLQIMPLVSRLMKKDLVGALIPQAIARDCSRSRANNRTNREQARSYSICARYACLLSLFLAWRTCPGNPESLHAI
jgi:hypothetical protein